MALRRVVILGGGYAGVRAAQEMLRRETDAELMLIDRGHYHQLVTEMYRVAAGGEQPDAAQLSLRRMLPTSPQLTLLRAEVQSLDVRDRVVHTSSGSVPYSYVLIALGGVPEYYGVPGALRHALTLKYLDSAVRVRRRLRAMAAKERRGHVVVVGGGLTGVQLAAEIADRMPGTFEIAIVQAAPSILPEEDKQLADYARRELERYHVTLHRGEPVTEVLEHSVRLKSGMDIPSDLTIWAGGVRANPLPGKAGLPCDKRGRVRVDDHLEVQDHPGVFAAGDVACVEIRRTGHPLPPTAQLAVQEGRQAGRNIVHAMKGEDLRSLRPRILGTAAALGEHRGIANIGRLRLTGRAGHVMHELALLHYLYGVGGIGLLRREAYLSWTHPPQQTAARG